MLILPMLSNGAPDMSRKDLEVARGHAAAICSLPKIHRPIESLAANGRQKRRCCLCPMCSASQGLKKGSARSSLSKNISPSNHPNDCAHGRQSRQPVQLHVVEALEEQGIQAANLAGDGPGSSLKKYWIADQKIKTSLLPIVRKACSRCVRDTFPGILTLSAFSAVLCGPFSLCSRPTAVSWRGAQ